MSADFKHMKIFLRCSFINVDFIFLPRGNSTSIQANVYYVFSESDITQPNAFINALLLVNKGVYFCS